MIHLEPLLFSIINATPLGEIIAAFDVKFPQYADDTHFCLAVDEENSLQASVNLVACTQSNTNGCYTTENDEACMLGISRGVQERHGILPPSYGDGCINNYFGSHQELVPQSLTFDQNTRKHLQGLVLSHTRFLTSTSGHEAFDCKCRACAIVGFILDYCNMLLAGMSGSNLDKLQCVQNCLERVVTGSRRRGHIKHSVKNCTGFLFGLESASRSRCSSIKSEQATNHHTLLTSLRTIYRRGQFCSSSMTLFEELLMKISTGRRCFHYNAAKIRNNVPETVPKP